MIVEPITVEGEFITVSLIVWRRWRRGVPFYSAGQDHVHHDLVLVHGFSQRKSVLLLYSWCLVLSGLAIAMQRQNRAAIIVLGVAAAIATAYMARLLIRYRSPHRGASGGELGNGMPGGSGGVSGPDESAGG